jgi:hypothetical protein
MIVRVVVLILIGSSSGRRTATATRVKKESKRERLKHRSGSWKGDSPELLGAFIVLNELDAIGSEAVNRANLRDDARRQLGTALIADDHGRTYGQFAMQVHCRSMLVQVRCFGLDSERRLLQVFTG